MVCLDLGNVDMMLQGIDEPGSAEQLSVGAADSALQKTSIEFLLNRVNTCTVLCIGITIRCNSINTSLEVWGKKLGKSHVRTLLGV